MEGVLLVFLLISIWFMICKNVTRRIIRIHISRLSWHPSAWSGTVFPFTFCPARIWRTPSTTSLLSSHVLIICSSLSACWTTALPECFNGNINISQISQSEPQSQHLPQAFLRNGGILRSPVPQVSLSRQPHHSQVEQLNSTPCF